MEYLTCKRCGEEKFEILLKQQKAVIICTCCSKETGAINYGQETLNNKETYRVARVS